MVVTSMICVYLSRHCTPKNKKEQKHRNTTLYYKRHEFGKGGETVSARKVVKENLYQICSSKAKRGVSNRDMEEGVTYMLATYRMICYNNA